VTRRVFHPVDLDLTARAISDMGQRISAWYEADGPRTPEALAHSYVSLVLRMLGAQPAQ
jgi:hypothetical protein